MGRVVANTLVDGAKDVKDLSSLCEIAFEDFRSQVNGNLEFDKNILSQTLTVKFPSTQDTEIAVDHNLGKIINDYIVCQKNVSCDVYSGDTQNTNNTIYLKCDVADAVVKIILKV